MNFYDCLTAATLAAIDQDVPTWLLPMTINNHASILSGRGPDADDLMN